MKLAEIENIKNTSTDPLDKKWLAVNIPCQAACPIQTDIPGYIHAIMDGDYQKAYEINRLDNVLPGVLGRVCNRPCEPVCRHGRDGLGEPVSICFLKRAAADYGQTVQTAEITQNGKHICIIGAGPAGLTAANDLALKGYQVTILEQFDQPGGMLRYGIPQFRLPYDVVAADVKSILDLGVTLKTNSRIHEKKHLDELKKEYDAVILAGGCMLPKTSEIPGLDSPGVTMGIDFMMAANRENSMADLGNVVVIGGGFTAVDCTRMAYRLGATRITLAYRRTKDDMTVSHHELDAMEAEGIHLSFLVAPVRIETIAGKTSGITFSHQQIHADHSISAIENSEFVMPADTVIFAIGQQAEENIMANQRYTREDNFFVSGDFRNGASTVIQAAADGRKIAREVQQFLSASAGFEEVVHISPVKETGRKRDYDFIPRQTMDVTPLFLRQEKNKEVETGFSREKAQMEAKRCYLCHYNFQIDINRCIYCLACIDVMPVDCINMVKDIEIGPDGSLRYVVAEKWSDVQAITINNDKCIRCGNCLRACPVECISVSKFQLETEEKK